MEGSIVQLKNEIASFDILFNTITFFYKRGKGRRIAIFESKIPDENVDSGYYARYLLDAKHVVEYRIANGRNIFLSILSLAIGPQYFTLQTSEIMKTHSDLAWRRQMKQSYII
jgi:protease II